MYRVRVEPDGKVISAGEGKSLLDVLSDHGVTLTSPCGGEGTCGKCRLRARGAMNAPTMSERSILGDLLDENVRLACQTIPEGDVTVEVPDSSRVPNVRVLAGGVGREVPYFPNVRRRPFLWERLDLEATGSEVDVVAERLDARADLKVALPVLRELAVALKPGQKYYGTILGDHLIAIDADDEPGPILGVALDVGTTTLVAQVVNLLTGANVGTASAVNDQTQYGNDVVTRINHAVAMEHGLDELRDAVRTTVERTLQIALEKSGLSPSHIYEATVVGNTTMLHLFAGVPPNSLGTLPFAPVFSSGLDIPAAELRLPFHPLANVHIVPSIAGYVGADTVAAMMATRFDEPYDGIRLLADIGTNCELVLQRGDETIACSTPAGPAFEGARMEFGMLGGPGAIEAVTFDDDCELRVIGRGSPLGLCGSGIVDIAAELLRVGIIDETGRLQDVEELPQDVPPNIRGRIRPLEKGNAFELAHAPDGTPILFTQRDVRELQLAKAAISTGISSLLDVAGVKPDELDELLIAGGFGNYLNKENAKRLGMIPNLPDDRIRYVGNAAIVGARLALISLDMRARSERVARRIHHIQIARRPDFQLRYTEAMLFEPVG